MYIPLTIPSWIWLAIRFNSKARGHAAFLYMSSWDGGKPLAWADCMTMNGGGASCLGCLHSPPPPGSRFSLPLLMVNAYRLYTDYSALAFRESSVRWWQRGERHAGGEVKAMEGGGENPLYIHRLPAWLAIHPELQVISSLPRPPSFSALHLFYQQWQWLQKPKKEKK